MILHYYPGCTLKTKSKNFEDSAIASLAALGLNLVELPRWNCCGATYSLADDDLIHQVAPVRNLIRAREQGADKLLTLCAFCCNTLKRANRIMKHDEEKRKTLNSFMDEEPDYAGEVEPVHLLEVLRDEVGWEALAAKVARPLTGLRVAPYYGCTLVRPLETAIDDGERPSVLHALLGALGAAPVGFPFETECCGSFQVMGGIKTVNECAGNILRSAASRGAEVLAVSCPLCEYNLARTQQDIRGQQAGSNGLPVLYFTQLLALALGVGQQCRFELGYSDARPLLEARGLIARE